MSTSKLHTKFPQAGDIPAAASLTVLRQSSFLVNGEFREWTGPVEEVRSPILVRSGAALEAPIVGSYPLLGESEALEALEAARSAYGAGAGTWPTLSVSERIACVEDFTFRMV